MLIFCRVGGCLEVRGVAKAVPGMMRAPCLRRHAMLIIDSNLWQGCTAPRSYIDYLYHITTPRPGYWTGSVPNDIVRTGVALQAMTGTRPRGFGGAAVGGKRPRVGLTFREQHHDGESKARGSVRELAEVLGRLARLRRLRELHCCGASMRRLMYSRTWYDSLNTQP